MSLYLNVYCNTHRNGSSKRWCHICFCCCFPASPSNQPLEKRVWECATLLCFYEAILFLKQYENFWALLASEQRRKAWLHLTFYVISNGQESCRNTRDLILTEGNSRLKMESAGRPTEAFYEIIKTWISNQDSHLRPLQRGDQHGSVWCVFRLHQ